MNGQQRFYGKYRGTVINPIDLDLKGKILASVTVGGAPLQVVAEACTPYPGFYAIPPVGSGVWIEFEEGDLDKPIWTGCWWHDGEVLALLSPDLPPPTPATAPGPVVFSVAPTGYPAAKATARLKLSAVTGTATLETLIPPATPATPTAVQITPVQIQISLGPKNKIVITPANIDMNSTALTIV